MVGGANKPKENGPAGDNGPIRTAQTEVEKWLTGVLGTQVTTAPSTSEPVILYPLELNADQQMLGAARREPFRFRIRFLVTVSSPKHLHLLDKVLVAAVNAGRPAIDLTPVPSELWAALGLKPGPALVIEVPAQVTPIEPEAPLVRRPLRLEHLPTRALAGQVTGPDDTPLAGMRVEAAAGRLVTYTDADGRFSFAGGVPAQQRILLRLSGRQRTLVAEVSPEGDEPVIIQCEFEES